MAAADKCLYLASINALRRYSAVLVEGAAFPVQKIMFAADRHTIMNLKAMEFARVRTEANKIFAAENPEEIVIEVVQVSAGSPYHIINLEF